jgi:hypothetical protein
MDPPSTIALSGCDTRHCLGRLSNTAIGHAIYSFEAAALAERRAECSVRDDNRISYGCVSVPTGTRPPRFSLYRAVCCSVMGATTVIP